MSCHCVGSMTNPKCPIHGEWRERAASHAQGAIKAMSEAPERIWVHPENNDQSGTWFIAGTRPRLNMQDVEYIRADRASPISEETMERLRARVADIDCKAEMDGPATLTTDEFLIRNLADGLL